MLLLCSISSFAQLTLSWPVERAVFQRDNSGNATVVFAGQTPIAWLGPWQLSYKIDRLTFAGAYSSSYIGWTNIATPGLGKVFRFSHSIPTGWYLITVKLMDGATQIASYGTKFGVGEVFIIAGQSNSTGEGAVSYSSSTSYDCVISSSQTLSNKCTGELPEYPIFGVLNSTSSYISPNAVQPWAYNLLGNKIAALDSPSTVTPVMFFNAGLPGSSSIDWTLTADDPTEDRSTNYGFARCTQAGGNGVGTGEPYRSLRNSLNYYGSLFGVRGIIWHQGEADNDLGTSSADYTTNLNNVIDKSRAHFNNNLSWAVSRVSWNGSTTDSDITTGQADTRSQRSAIMALDSSDYYLPPTLRQTTEDFNLGVHFNYPGLIKIAKRYFAQASNLLSQTPVSANQLVPVIITQVGSNKEIAIDFTAMGKSSSDFNCYEWTQGDHYSTATYPVGNCTTAYSVKTVTTNGQWRCYMRDSKGNVYMTQKLTINTDPNVRVANPPTISSVYPNPTEEDLENTITFDLEYKALVKLELITENGELIKLLADEVHETGKYHYPFTLKNKGVREYQTYYYRLTVNGMSETKRIVVD